MRVIKLYKYKQFKIQLKKDPTFQTYNNIPNSWQIALVWALLGKFQG